jgi:hypothetical protein
VTLFRTKNLSGAAMKSQTYFLVAGGLAGLAAIAVTAWNLVEERRYVTTVRTEYHNPKPADDDFLKDDRLEDKPAKFDAALVDRRPLGAWLVNQSAAVIRLDCPAIKPDREAALLKLYPSYAALGAQKLSPLLPSVNMLDGKAKQFDDGLYAALDQAYYRGLKGKLLGHVELVKRLYDKVGPESEAAPFLAAGLELAGVQVHVKGVGKKNVWLDMFEADQVQSKPSGFYTWNETLKSCFRFLRFFQRQFGEKELWLPVSLANVLAGDKDLLADYQKAMQFYARLTNPYACLSLADLVGVKPSDPKQFAALCRAKKVTHQAAVVFPPSTARETVLFEKLFPLGLPPDADLMCELVRRIRSGEVDLKPRPDSGWYEYQVYALETFLLPEKGEERDRLLLTKNYKKRMLEAFKALITKRRETHLRQHGDSLASAQRPPAIVQPRLRLEPCPSYYLRTARAYAFLANFLETAVGKDALQSLHGLTKDGQRQPNLHAELESMRELFYGFYLVSADDIGLKTALLKDEPVDIERCYQRAIKWLAKAFDDPDLAADTRVSVPIFVDRGRNVTRLWATLGVRLAKLEASYARSPHIKLAALDPKKASENNKGQRIDPDSPKSRDWQPVEGHTLRDATYLIPVDEFAEIELAGLKSLTREELRTICDREKTKEAILTAFGRPTRDSTEPASAGEGFVIREKWIAPLALVGVAVVFLLLSRVLKT